jgi:hypothetical protein
MVIESLRPGFFQAKYLKLKHLMPFWPELIQAKPVICYDF